MTEEFTIEDGSSLLPAAKRGRPKEREIAHKAAEAIRNGQFNSIEDAASAFFDEHLQRRPITNSSDPDARRDRLKAFTRFIEDDLRANPKSLRSFAALSKRKRKQDEQPAAKARRAEKLTAHIRHVLDLPD